jgi:hypothetical protein
MDLYAKHRMSRIHGDWSYLVSQSYKLVEPGFRKEVFQFASLMMARARVLIEGIVEDLLKEGYRFADPSRIHEPPDVGLLDCIKDFEQCEVYLPISLQAWLAVVGTVDLRGTHPGWPRPGYVFDDMSPTNDVVYADPLVVYLSADYLGYLRREWEMNVRDEGARNVGPFNVSISPDHIHKANVSGGAPYEISTQTFAVDSLLFNERHCTSLTSYLRTSLIWGGFPGLEYSKYRETATALPGLMTRAGVRPGF